MDISQMWLSVSITGIEHYDRTGSGFRSLWFTHAKLAATYVWLWSCPCPVLASVHAPVPASAHAPISVPCPCCCPSPCLCSCPCPCPCLCFYLSSCPYSCPLLLLLPQPMPLFLSLVLLLPLSLFMPRFCPCRVLARPYTSIAIQLPGLVSTLLYKNGSMEICICILYLSSERFIQKRFFYLNRFFSEIFYVWKVRQYKTKLLSDETKAMYLDSVLSQV